MTRSSAGGAGAARGIGHEGRCLAWAAAYMLAETSLPEWASGRRVVAIGGQTGRTVDDIGIVTDDDGWVMIQAKKGLTLAKAESSRLAEAIDQLVEVEALGVPDRPPHLDRSRPLDPDTDRVLVLTDHAGPRNVDQFLAPVTDRLRELPMVCPLADVHRNADDRHAFELVRDHLSRSWKARHRTQLGEADLRRLGHVLCVRTMDLVNGGRHLTVVHNVLAAVAPRPEDVPRIWQVLEREAQRLAEERSFLDRKGLVRRLELAGIALLPVARLRPDIAHLRAVTEANVALLADALTIAAPEGPVALTRAVSPIITAADGNVAITGAPGAGKTVILHTVATASRPQGVDVVVLRANNLRASGGQTRQELNLDHDLSEAMVSWTGTDPGLLLVDGLDQTRGVDASAWLPDLANALKGSRWRIVATIRTFDLKHGPRWRQMFRGATVDQHCADPDLTDVRHIVVADLTDTELDPLRAASLQLARLLDDADSRLRELLTNPFNIDLAAQLLASNADVDFTTIRSRVDLLHSYWQRRVAGEPAELERMRTLRAVVDLMVREGCQLANPLDLPTDATSQALTALHSDAVLRDLPTSPGHAGAPVEFFHPVLFDYAVAMLALGDTNRPESLADRLDQDPNLTITVRPSLDYRLATVWRDDPQRRRFWRLSLRLASRSAGHPLAASAAARVAAREIQTLTDCQPLADACVGTAIDEYGMSGTTEAHELAFLLAAAISRGPSTDKANAALAALTSHLARQARHADNIDLALLAAQLPARALSHRPTALAAHIAEHLVPAAVECMTMALADLADPRRTQLAEITSRLLAHAAVVDPVATATVIEGLCSRDALQAWGVRHMWPLIDRIPNIAQRAPDLAVTLGAAVWEYEETQDEQTNLLGSAILGLTSNRKQDLDGTRHRVGTKFKDLAAVDAGAATLLLLRIVDPPSVSPWPERTEFPAPPHPRLGDTLQFSAGHGALLSMTNGLIERLINIADLNGDPTDNTDTHVPPRPLADIVGQIVARLRHDEVWQRLLFHAATARSPALARALLPALLAPNLYAYPSTWLPAAHIVRRLLPLLSVGDHIRLETALWGLVEAANGTHEPDPHRDEPLYRRRDMLIGCLHPEKVGRSEVRQRLAELDQAADASDLPELDENQLDGVGEMVWEAEPPAAGSVEDIQHQVSATIQQARSNNEHERAHAVQRLIGIWAELRPLADASEVPCSSRADVTMADVRVELAEHLACAPEAAPDTALGREIYSTLRASLPTPKQPAADDEADGIWLTAPTPAWSGTTSNNALQGIAALVMRAEWRAEHGDELAALLTPFLGSPSPSYRYLASRALPGLHPKPEELFGELQQRLFTETDRHIATYLLGQLGRFRYSKPVEIDNTLLRLARQPEWACATTDPQADHRPGHDNRWVLVVNLLTILAAVHTTPYAVAVVRTWLTHPIDHPDRAAQATACLRDVLNPADTALWPAQERAFHLLEPSLRQLRDAWAEREQPGQPTSERQDRMSRLIKVADNIGQQLYFASGAFDHTKSPACITPKGDLLRFSTFALPLLEHLSAIGYPAVTHHITQTIDHLRPVQPRRALLIAAQAITNDPGYAREPLALDAVHLLVRHYLSDHRELVLSDPTCISGIRAMLEVFVRVGWDKAIELAEELDDLFG
ncbi:MAG: hypothetical protein ACRDTX_13615 [Pseudonocardiaceae bacterium]